ncbi:hypothetical protein HanHA89_Chr04g0164831 [Helianthus annuus]|nr:hypothetical protein HanHA89_Chr04g0164831 [Helianthus annuus]
MNFSEVPAAENPRRLNFNDECEAVLESCGFVDDELHGKVPCGVGISVFGYVGFELLRVADGAGD